ncbi:autophagy protein Apg5-domain-containing protein [Paraphysoderma sedebokerense]|nr:autophagy protein Apg5-domain-containing protein [Paraphysoderma sedebokerense]
MTSTIGNVDDDFLLSIWEGQLPIHFSLDPVEAGNIGLKPSDSLYLMLPRCSYLSLHTPTIQKFFVEQSISLLTVGDESEIWYEYNGVPLKWHYPIGLLYDLFAATSSISSSPSKSPQSSQFPAAGLTPAVSLPWKLTVHFQNFPNDKLLKVQNSDTVQDFFMSMLKEADYMRHGSTKTIMGLSKSDQLQLWESFRTHSFTNFQKVNKTLVPEDLKSIKSLPIRLYLCSRERQKENNQLQYTVVQEPIGILKEGQDKPLTLQEYLSLAMPFQNILEAAIRIHGIDMPTDTTVDWIYKSLWYPDNWVHVVVTL